MLDTKAVRITVRDLRIGEILVSAGTRDFHSRVVSTEPCQAGQIVTGPRGGRYRLNSRGARDFIVVVLADGRRPVLLVTATVTVLRAAA